MFGPEEARGLQSRLSATGRALEAIMCYWNYLLVWRQISAGAVDLTSLRVGTGVGLNCLPWGPPGICKYH